MCFRIRISFDTRDLLQTLLLQAGEGAVCYMHVFLAQPPQQLR